MKSLLFVAALVLSSLAFAHAHAPWVDPKVLDDVRKMSPALLEDIYKNLGGEVEDVKLREKAQAAALRFHEGLKKDPQFDEYTRRIPRFELALFKGSEKTDIFNAFFFGGRNNLGKCQLVNTLLLSEGILRELGSEELIWMMAHELVHLLKGHKCLPQEQRLAFYQGDLLSVLDEPKALAAGEVAFLRAKFPKLHAQGGLILPGTDAYREFREKSRVFTSEIEADEGQVAILAKLNLFELGPVAESFYKKASVVKGEKLDCEGVSPDYSAKDYLDSFNHNLTNPEGTLHPSLCTRLQHTRAEIAAHPPAKN